MTVGELEAALISIQGDDVVQLEEVGDLLIALPVAGIDHLVVVVRGPQEVQRRSIPGIPIGVDQRSISAAVQRDVRVAMQICPVDGIGPVAGTNPVGADSLQIFLLAGVDGSAERGSRSDRGLR